MVLRVVPEPEASALHRNLLEIHFGVLPVESETLMVVLRNLFVCWFFIFQLELIYNILLVSGVHPSD